MASLDHLTSRPPVGPQGSGKAGACVGSLIPGGVCGVERPQESSAEVVLLLVQALQPGDRFPCCQLGFGTLRQLGKHGSMPVAHVVRLPGLLKSLTRVLSHGLQHPVAHAVGAMLCDHQGLVHEPRQRIQHLLCWQHGFQRFQSPSAREYRDRAKERALLFVEEVVTPIEQVTHGLMSRGDGPPCSSQQPQRVIEPGGDLPDGEHAHTGSSEFDSQWHTIQPPADLRQIQGVSFGHGEVWLAEASPLQEQAHRVVREERSTVGSGGGGRHRERTEGYTCLARQSKWLPARG